jgi:formamidopyrimidine-DNA glycosylase
MPELPEVEIVKRGLSTLIVGKTIKAVTHDTPKSFPNDSASVEKFLVNAEFVLYAAGQKYSS